MKTKKYVEYMVEETKKILAIDSPSGYTADVADYVMKAYQKLGYEPKLTTKGGVLVALGGKDKKNAVMLEAHIDTLGAMVAEIKSNGRLRVTPVGGMNANNAEAENCRIHTRFGEKVYEGTLQLANASIHVNGDYNDKKRTFDETEIVLDEKVHSRADVEALGIMTGDIVCFDPRTTVTESGYIKSRFLDDKLSASVLLGLARAVAAGEVTLDAVAARCADPAIADDLKYVLATANAMAAGRYQVAYCPSLVRGQGYYTGMVFEITCPQFSGAVAGGGRYDNMVGKFLGTQVPAVGFSIGFERVCGILLEQGYQIPGAKQKIALLYGKDADFTAVLSKAAALRDTYNVTVLPQGKKLGKQLGQLEAAGFAGAAFMDKDEVKVFAAQ